SNPPKDKPLVLDPFLDILCSMLRIIVLLKHDTTWIQAVTLYGPPQIVFRNGSTQMLIHSNFYFAHESRTGPSHAPPDHQRTTTMLYCLLHLVRLGGFCVAFPKPGTAIQSKMINFSFIRPDYTIPVGNCPILVSLSKAKRLQMWTGESLDLLIFSA